MLWVPNVNNSWWWTMCLLYYDDGSDFDAPDWASFFTSGVKFLPTKEWSMWFAQTAFECSWLFQFPRFRSFCSFSLLTSALHPLTTRLQASQQHRDLRQSIITLTGLYRIDICWIMGLRCIEVQVYPLQENLYMLINVFGLICYNNNAMAFPHMLTER